MKILMEGLGYGLGDNLGGSVRVAAANARAMVERGHEVSFWCTNLVDKRRKLFPGAYRSRDSNVEIVYLATRTMRFWTGVVGPHYTHIPRSVLSEISRFDIVHLTEFRSHLAARVGIAALSARVPLFIQPQGTLPLYDRSRLLKRLYDQIWGRRLLTGASALLAATQAEAEEMFALGIPIKRAQVIPNGLDIKAVGMLPLSGEFRKYLGIAPEIPLIVSVGRLDKVKGFDLMLRALTRIPPPATYVVVGPDHGFASKLRVIASELGLTERFRATGALPHPRDVYSAIVDADVFAVPSRHEAFGQVILEACLARRPMVLSSGCGVAREFRDRAALVVRPDVNELADACNRLLSDPNMRNRFGEEGRRILESDYRLEAVAAKLEKVYLDFHPVAVGRPRMCEHTGSTVERVQ